MDDDLIIIESDFAELNSLKPGLQQTSLLNGQDLESKSVGQEASHQSIETQNCQTWLCQRCSSQNALAGTFSKSIQSPSPPLIQNSCRSYTGISKSSQSTGPSLSTQLSQNQHIIEPIRERFTSDLTHRTKPNTVGLHHIAPFSLPPVSCNADPVL